MIQWNSKLKAYEIENTGVGDIKKYVIKLSRPFYPRSFSRKSNRTIIDDIIGEGGSHGWDFFRIALHTDEYSDAGRILSVDSRSADLYFDKENRVYFIGYNLSKEDVIRWLEYNKIPDSVLGKIKEAEITTRGMEHGRLPLEPGKLPSGINPGDTEKIIEDLIVTKIGDVPEDAFLLGEYTLYELRGY